MRVEINNNKEINNNSILMQCYNFELLANCDLKITRFNIIIINILNSDILRPKLRV